MLYLAGMRLPLLLLALLGPVRLACADGCLVERYDPYADRWDYRAERSQEAVILHRDGVERLSVAIEHEPSRAGLVWLLPVPAAPDKVALDVERGFPAFHGEEVRKAAGARLREAAEKAALTQPQRFLGAGFEGLFGGMFAMGSLGAQEGGDVPDVVVHSRLEKEGIVTELVTARSAEGLAAYLARRGFKARGVPPSLRGYIGGEYSFAVSAISAGARHGRRALVVSFPAGELYFPLMPTSAYGAAVVPLTLRVEGFVTPALYKEIREFAKTEYFLSPSGQRYTRLDLKAPSDRLVDDLRLSLKAPLKARWYAALASTAEGWLVVGLLGYCSLLAGLLAGPLVFREWRSLKGLGKAAGVGACNCLSGLGLMLAVALVKTDGTELRKLVFIPLYSVVFLALLEWAQWMLLLP